MTRTLILVVTAACLVAGCAADAPEKKKAVPEPEFGSSVRNMVRAQTFNPQAGKAAAAEAPAGMDGDKAAAAVKAYRAEKPASGTAPTPIVISPGQ